MEQPNDPSSKVAIGARLQLLRERFELSGKEMADAAGLAASSSITQWEKGDTTIAWENAIRLCKRFGVTMDWIYRGDIGSLPGNVYERLYGKRDGKPAVGRRARPFSAAE